MFSDKQEAKNIGVSLKIRLAKSVRVYGRFFETRDARIGYRSVIGEIEGTDIKG